MFVEKVLCYPQLSPKQKHILIFVSPKNMFCPLPLFANAIQNIYISQTYFPTSDHPPQTYFRKVYSSSQNILITLKHFSNNHYLSPGSCLCVCVCFCFGWETLVPPNNVLFQNAFPNIIAPTNYCSNII